MLIRLWASSARLLFDSCAVFRGAEIVPKPFILNQISIKMSTRLQTTKACESFADIESWTCRNQSR